MAAAVKRRPAKALGNVQILSDLVTMMQHTESRGGHQVG